MESEDDACEQVSLSFCVVGGEEGLGHVDRSHRKVHHDCQRRGDMGAVSGEGRPDSHRDWNQGMRVCFYLLVKFMDGLYYGGFAT